MTDKEHKCNKELEIAEIHTDMKYIRKLLEGNGKKGLVDKVEENTRIRWMVIGGAILMGSAVGVGFILFIMRTSLGA